MKELIVKKTITINADISKVWNALTDPNMTKKYMYGCAVITDWKVGSPILWKGISDGVESILIKGSIEKIEPGRLLQYTTLDPHASYPAIPSKTVRATFELMPKLGKTVLSVSQGDFTKVENSIRRFNETAGGLEKVLLDLKALLENKP